MDQAAIAKLLEPFLVEPLSPVQLNNISMYIDMLLRWNARMNLTAIRQPEEIATRHFGESLFAARHLGLILEEVPRLIDVGSGAGFPGLPIKIFYPDASLILVESNHKKVAFLREVIRALDLKDAQAFAGRAEDLIPSAPNNVVTLRAVERFADVLPTAIRLAGTHGCMALLIGEDQEAAAKSIFPKWDSQIPIPNSSQRVLLLSQQN